MNKLDVIFPTDLKQTPDIIINIYIQKSSLFSGDQKERLGYIRMPAKDCVRT
jgi:hypothetical protein